jgi:DNA invertase Pin-like site-specific DNA recombinase
MMKRVKKAALYARVSTTGQTVSNQLQELRKVAENHGWEIVHEYRDQGISGAKGRDKRPQFDQMLKAANRREFDIIMSWSVDRLGRSLQHLVEFLGDIQGKGVDLYLHQQNIDTSTPSGKAMFQMVGVFAEFERAMIQERVKAGLARARKDGKILGRPKVSAEIEDKIRAARKEGQGMLKISRTLGVGVSTVQRVLAA